MLPRISQYGDVHFRRKRVALCEKLRDALTRMVQHSLDRPCGVIKIKLDDSMVSKILLKEFSSPSLTTSCKSPAILSWIGIIINRNSLSTIVWTSAVVSFSTSCSSQRISHVSNRYHATCLTRKSIWALHVPNLRRRINGRLVQATAIIAKIKIAFSASSRGVLDRSAAKIA